MASNLTATRFQSFLADGTTPNASGKVYVYENTTVVETNSYTDRAAGTPNLNPVICDSGGYCAIWLPEGAQYTIAEETSADVPIRSTDGISVTDLENWVVSGSNISFSAGNVGIGGVAGSETLKVTGTFAVTSTAAITGNVTLDRALTVNESGSDFDLRAEGLTATNLFVVNAGADQVNIGTTTEGALAQFSSGLISLKQLTQVTGGLQVLSGDLNISAAGAALAINTGVATDYAGTAVLSGGTITVSHTGITATDLIICSRSTTGGTEGHLSYTISASTSFTINSSSGSDTSTIAYLIVKQL